MGAPSGAGGFSGAPVAAAANYPEASQAVMVLVLGLLPLTGCLLPLAPLAWFLGTKELAGIDSGQRPPEQRNLANIGRILGIVGTVIFALAFLSVGCSVVIL